jgi:diguanylate cyclase (GGDEF)-like protein
MYDDLTGLPNRHLFADRLQLALARTERHRSEAAVILLDVDGFETLAGKAGGGVADAVLREVGDRIETVIRPGDTVARVEAAQFAVLCEEIADEADAVAIAERVAAGMAFPFDVDDLSAHLSVSAGLALARGQDADPQALIESAGAALRAARSRGGARLEVFRGP